MTNGICRTRSENTAASDQRRTTWIGQEVEGGRDGMAYLGYFPKNLITSSTAFWQTGKGGAERKRKTRRRKFFTSPIGGMVSDEEAIKTAQKNWVAACDCLPPGESLLAAPPPALSVSYKLVSINLSPPLSVLSSKRTQIPSGYYFQQK